MAAQIDSFGRELLMETIPGGGTRYFSRDRSICVGLKPANDAEALRIFNETPPPALQVPEIVQPEADDLITKIESMSKSQRKRLKAVLLSIQKE